MSQNFGANNSTPSSPDSPQSADTLKSITAFSRFEFEFGRGNDGTKILMVEFEDDDTSRDPAGTWQVSWSGKTTVLPADESTSDNSRRLYFLLPPGVMVPPRVVLTYSPPATSSSVSQQPQRLTLNPLPAIFAPDLGATARTTGKKGVLHTIWAKKRLQVLEKEIKREEQFNLEGIALDLAKAEKEWIEENFGVTIPRRPTLEFGSLPRFSNGAQSPGLTTPRTPGGRKLSDKLKGLSLGTSDKDLMRKDSANTPSHDVHPLSPDGDDVAYSSFQSFRQTPATASSAGTSRIKAQFPPDHIRQQQTDSPASMDYISQQEPGDELFAKSMSPRSPDDPKSPFSFSSADTKPFSTIKGER